MPVYWAADELLIEWICCGLLFSSALFPFSRDLPLSPGVRSIYGSRFTSARRCYAHAAALLILFGGARFVRADVAADPVKMVFVGDVMVGEDEETGKMIAQGEDPFTPFARLLRDADAAIGNLECVVATQGEKVHKPYNFRAKPECIPLLKQHFTAFTVANN